MSWCDAPVPDIDMDAIDRMAAVVELRAARTADDASAATWRAADMLPAATRPGPHHDPAAAGRRAATAGLHDGSWVRLWLLSDGQTWQRERERRSDRHDTEHANFLLLFEKPRQRKLAKRLTDVTCGGR